MDNIEDVKRECERYRLLYENADKSLAYWEEKCRRFEQENERLKEENYQLQKDCQICENFIDFIPCKPIRDMDYDLQKVISQRDNYYQALQEIKEYAIGLIDGIIGGCETDIGMTLLKKINKTIGENING